MADKPMLITRARSMRKQPSRAERAVWEIVRDRKLGVKFRRQHPVEGYIADFACINAKLIVEVDDFSHRDDKQQAYDAERSRILEGSGWRLLRVRDTDVLRDSASISAAITLALGL